MRRINTIIRRFLKSQTRTALAVIFLVLLALVLAWAVRKDFESKIYEQLLSLPMARYNNYIIDLNSIDLDTQTVKGTIRVKAGLPVWNDKKHTVFYAKLSYVDLAYTYAFLRDFVDFNIGILKSRALLPDSAFSKSYPAPIEFTIKALGRPEIYPFDKYFIMGAVTCPTYIVEGKRKNYLNIGEESESLSVNNFVKGLFIRKPSKSELDGIISASTIFTGKKASPTTYEEVNKLNNLQDRFALVMERSLYLKIMAIVLGIIALISALYIGFKTPFKDIPVPIIGFIIGLWGIRSILLGDLKIFPSYFDYTILLMYLLAFAGVIFRLIKGGWKEKGKDGEKIES